MTPLRGFVIFFDEKEGTSALVRLLDGVAGVSIVHHADGTGWEPFDRHNCGAMPLASLRTCLASVLGVGPLGMDELNHHYMRTARGPLAPIGQSDVVGFKMRFSAPAQPGSPVIARVPGLGPRLHRAVHDRSQRAFESTVMELLVEVGAVVFMAVRQDVLRWALSKYHGDGTGRPGHLQFALAAGEIDRDEIPRITVDLDRLGVTIAECEALIEAKRTLVAALEAAGVPAHVLLYERFLADPRSVVSDLLDKVGATPSPAEVNAAFEAGMHFEKVHDADIATFVTNHEEVLARFGDRFVTWR